MKRMKKMDFLVIFILVIFSIALYFITNKNFNEDDNSNKIAVITIDGKVYKEIKLTKGLDENIEIKSKYGENVITIKNDVVHMHESDCKDRICIKMGKIKTPGDSIICLPNRFMVKIISEKEDNNDLDMILK